MPRQDPTTGCTVLTVWDVLADEAKREGKGRTAGDLFSDMMDEMQRDNDTAAQRMTAPDVAMRMLNDALKENDGYLQPSDAGYIGYKVAMVLRVSDAHVNSGFRDSSESFYAEVEGDDAKTHTLHYASWHSSGSFYEPPDGETIVHEVLPANPTTPHHCPKCGRENSLHRKGKPSGRIYTCDHCEVEWPVIPQTEEK